MNIDKSLVHVTLQCTKCDFNTDDYINAVKKSDDHNKQTGHTIIGEFGYAVTIER